MFGGPVMIEFWPFAVQRSAAPNLETVEPRDAEFNDFINDWNNVPSYQTHFVQFGDINCYWMCPVALTDSYRHFKTIDLHYIFKDCFYISWVNISLISLSSFLQISSLIQLVLSENLIEWNDTRLLRVGWSNFKTKKCFVIFLIFFCFVLFFNIKKNVIKNDRHFCVLSQRRLTFFLLLRFLSLSRSLQAKL